MKKTLGIICGGVLILLVLSGISFAGTNGDHMGDGMTGGSSPRMDQISGNGEGDHSHGAHQQHQMQTMGQNMSDPDIHNEIMDRKMKESDLMNKEIDLKPQTVCPVMGGKIDKNVYVDYQGQRVYFCCSSCKAAFLKEPEKYMKKLAEEKVLLEKSTQ